MTGILGGRSSRAPQTAPARVLRRCRKTRERTGGQCPTVSICERGATRIFRQETKRRNEGAQNKRRGHGVYDDDRRTLDEGGAQGQEEAGDEPRPLSREAVREGHPEDDGEARHENDDPARDDEGGWRSRSRRSRFRSRDGRDPLPAARTIQSSTRTQAAITYNVSEGYAYQPGSIRLPGGVPQRGGARAPRRCSPGKAVTTKRAASAPPPR